MQAAISLTEAYDMALAAQEQAEAETQTAEFVELVEQSLIIGVSLICGDCIHCSCRLLLCKQALAMLSYSQGLMQFRR